MNEETPLGSPPIGSQGVAGWPWWVAGQPTHVAKSSPICPQGAAVEIKMKIVEGKEGKCGETSL
jgi:hypothetical protein